MPADITTNQNPGEAKGQAADTTAARERASGARTLRRVAPYLWPADKLWVKQRVVLALLALLASKVVSVGTPILYKYAVDSLSGQGVPDLALGAVGLTVAYGMARLMGVGFQQLRDVVFAKVGQRALRTLALETFQHIHELSMRYHITRKTGGLSRIIERGVKGVDFLLRFLLFSIGPLIMIAVLLMVLFDVSYTAIVCVTIVLYGWFTFAGTEWRVKLRKVMNDQDTDANQKAIDSLLNFEMVKYFGAEAREAARYDSAMRQYEAAALKTSYSLAFLNFGQSFLITAGLVIVMVMAAIGVQQEVLTVGDFVMVNAYMIQITMPLNFLGTVYREIRQALVDMGEMFDLLDQPSEIKDKPDARALDVRGGQVALEGVHFGYDPERTILKGVTLTAEPGQTVAIVGSTGSGKSTIGRLLFRCYDVNEGALKIDGQDVRDVTQDSLHAAIGVVPQDTVLFNDTIRYNIGYGLAGATQAQIEDAARAAQIHDFIATLPDGYDSPVGERGVMLSGGQKQRIAIARAILRDAPVLLLDEATSALDSESEQAVQQAVEALSADRTTIIVAHRLSTVKKADRIIVMEEGRIVAQGSHDALLAKGGLYARYWGRQSGGFLNLEAAE